MIKSFGLYSEEELASSGLRFGKNVSISNDVIIHNPQNVEIGDNVRIDAQCILIAGKNFNIKIGSNVHISIGCVYYGNSGNITLEDYCCTSGRCMLYTCNDDYTEGFLTNPTVDESLKKLTAGDIILKKHCVVGANSVILPGVILNEATSSGAFSLIKKSSESFDVLVGAPAKAIAKRKNTIIKNFL